MNDGRSSLLEGTEGKPFGSPPALPSIAHAGGGGREYESVKVQGHDLS
jgi:hypothetical protein